MKYYDYLDNEEENKIKHVLENETKSDALHGIIVLGVDNYVIVNEMYGRQYGEFILRHVNDIILDMFRGSDIIVRLRGDEFIILSRNIKELGNIDWSAPAITIERLVRGLNPWPSAYTFLNDKTFKIWKSQVIEETTPAPAGSVVRTDREGIYVQTGDNLLLLQEVQMEGKKRMRAADFCNGYAMDNIQLKR